ncbi:MAG: hypothetical protein KJ792_00195 [Actinobacteria bacterium]|nr:hypothetical protein [Actinomycetota bacterium]
MSDDATGDRPEQPDQEQRRRRRVALVLLLLALLLILGLAVGHAMRTSGKPVGAPRPTVTAQPGRVPGAGPAATPASPEVLSQVLADDNPGSADRTEVGVAAGPARGGQEPASAESPASGATRPTSTPTRTPAPTPTGTPAPTPTGTSAPTPTGTPAPTPTGTPAPTPTGTATPCPGGCDPCPCAAGDVALAVHPTGGPAHQGVTLAATVRSALAGSVVLLDGERSLGSSPVAGHRAALTTNALGAGEHVLVAVFVSDDRTVTCASAAVVVRYGGAAPDEQTVVLSVPTGAVTVTTPYTPEHPLDLGEAVLDPATSTFSASADFDDIVVTDTRAGNLGFTVSVRSDGLTSPGGGTLGAEHLGLTRVRAVQVPGNALVATHVEVHDLVAGAPGLGEPGTLAHYPDGIGLGTARLRAVVELADVPSSVAPGRYRGTLVFTVM